MRRVLVLMMVASIMVLIPAGSAMADSQGSAARGLPKVTVIDFDFGNDGVVDSRETTYYSYNNRGLVTESTRKVDNGADGTIEGEETVFYTYDNRGLLIESVTDFGTTSVYSYNSRGLLTGVVASSDGGCDPEQEAMYIYNRRGLLIEEAIDLRLFPPCDVVLESDLEYTYDNRGNPSTTVQTLIAPIFGLDPLVFTSTLSYDNQGNLVTVVAERDLNGDGVDRVTTSTYSYDRFGNVTKVSNEIDVDLDGNPDLFSQTTFTYTY